ncbi:MAG: caspase family protein [Pirellulales bacterium]|nr:caspase family protein [Pirellulales bacterium]
MPRLLPLLKATAFLAFAMFSFPLQGQVAGAPARVGAELQLRYTRENPQLLVESEGFAGTITGLEFSPDGRLLAAGGDKQVRLWDLGDGRLVATLRGEIGEENLGLCRDLVFTPDGKHLIVAVDDDHGEVALRVYRAGAWEEVAEMLPGLRVPPRCLDVSRDGQYLAAMALVDEANDVSEISFWDWPGRRLIATRRVVFRTGMDYLGFPDDTNVYALMGSGVDQFAFFAPPLWEEVPADRVREETRKLLRDIGPDDLVDWPYETVWLDVVRPYFEDGRFLCGGRGVAEGKDVYWAALWRNEDAEPKQVFREIRYKTAALALSSDGKLFACGDELGNVYVWETRSGRRKFLLRGSARPLYNVSFDGTGRLLAFGNTPYPTGDWNYNHFGRLERSFDLHQRVVRDEVGEGHLQPVTAEGDLQLKLGTDDQDVTYLECRQNGRRLSYLDFPYNAPFTFGFLRSARTGAENPFVVGTQYGTFDCWDVQPDSLGRPQWKRQFFEHGGMVTAFSESPDGRLVATACSDGVLRIFDLNKFLRLGLLDCEIEWSGGRIYEVPPGQPCARAGVRVGDVIRKLDGMDWDTVRRRFASDWSMLERYAAGQKVALELQREDRTIQVEVELTPTRDLARPLLNLFISAQNEWVLWTPQGYYDASPGAERFIGWHVNRGWTKGAEFYGAGQFRHLYRPDIIDKILELGRVEQAVAVANANRPNSEAVDLRDRETFRRTEPPKVEIVEPRDGATSTKGEITVEIVVTSQNGLPIQNVKVLVNGRPPQAKNLVREEGDRTVRLRISENVVLAAGRNLITAIASNRVAVSAAESVAVTYAAPQEAPVKPDLYLVAVGISDYRAEGIDLKFAHRDAKEFAAAWKQQEGKFFGSVDVRLLTDAQATAAVIRDAMDWLVRSVTQHDVAVLFLSAHGVYDTRQNYYLTTHDMDLDRLRSTAIPYSDINRLVEDMPCKLLLFADTCHGGGLRGDKGLLDDPYRDLVAEDVGAVLFASSHPRELSLEGPDWQHGAFTRAFLDMMSDAKSDIDGDGYLSVTETDLNLSRRVKELTGGRQHPVTRKPPTIRDFNLARVGR